MICYNRYKEKIIIDKKSNDLYELEMNLQFCRCGYDENDLLNMVDPTGGPYISVGLFDMGYFNKEWSGDIVKEIIIENNIITLKTEKL
ncbi:MAG: hypothetical protein M0R46_06240 [Candidatus Muirbacterium halophilum]|nr:hypothetical protein [Candidatus Muirbacterium halophilum]